MRAFKDTAAQRDLERMIALAFTTGELSKFAERVAVFTDREGDVDRNARVLVNAVSKKGTVDRLLRHLGDVKPLVEWPDPDDILVELEPPVSEPPVSEPPASAPPASAGPPPSAGPPSSAPLLAPPIVDPFLQQPDTQPLKPARLWTAAVAIAIGAGALGAGMTRLLDAPEAAELPGQPVPLAHLAANHMAVAVDAVARACDAEVAAPSAREALSRAFASCAELPPPSRPRPALAAPEPPPPLRPPSYRIDAQPYRKKAPERPELCLERCNDVHDVCRTECGPEPGLSSKYPAYQRCLARCLTDSSRCRLDCR